MNALQTIQEKLKAPKNQRNNFGNYNYRSQEDILEAVKPLLKETNSTLIISDEIVDLGGSLFVKAVVTLSEDGSNGATVSKSWVATAYAKHPIEQKGMNDAQITGSTSSYARKYALNGLFLIDDTKDADATNTHGKDEQSAKKSPAASKKAAAPVKAESAPAKEEKPAAEKISNTNEKGEPVKKKVLELETKQFDSVKKKLEEGSATLETVKKFFALTEEVEAELKKVKPAAA